MAKSSENKTASLEQQAHLEVLNKESQHKKLAERYRNEEKVPVTLSPFYAPYLGRTAMVSVQGIPVYIPADGRMYLVNKTHAAQLFDSMFRIDEKIKKTNRLSNVESNFESSAGALRLF